MTSLKKSNLSLNNIYNCPVSEKITYPIGAIKWVHIEFLNEYYSGAKKSLLYLEKEVRKMEKTGDACMWEYGVAVSTLNEMRKALMVGMFHLWFHNLQEYFTMGGKEFHSQKLQFMTLGFDSLIGIFKDLIDKNLIKTIKKYSLLTNAIKHGLGPALVDLRKGYPEFFYPSQEYTKTDEEGNVCQDAREPLVTKEHFEELHNKLLEFWEIVPDKISVDIQKLIQNKKVRMLCMKNIVILTGSGISAESGLKTFRSEDGLWLNHRVEDICTVEAFERNPALVHSFYNELRPIMMKATPNAGHQAITMLQQELPEVTINVVTQNVDLLHEKAGSKNIYHIHGRIDECVCMNCGHVLTTLGDVESDEVCPECHVQGMLKPNIVFFGEMPKYMDEVDKMLAECDMFIAIGTSGVVYPAAGFVRRAKFYGAKTYLFNLDPCNNSSQFDKEILGKASQTFPKFAEDLIKELKQSNN